MSTPLRVANSHPRIELWLKGQPPTACTVSKLAANHLIFLSLLEEPAQDTGANHTDELTELVIFDGSGDPLYIQARVTNHTRERWVLDPLERCRPLLSRLRHLLQQNPAGEQQPTPNAPRLYRRSGLLNECRQIMREFISVRYAVFYSRLDDALLLASVTDAPHQQAYLDAIRAFEQAHSEVEQDFMERVDTMIGAASKPGFTPAEPAFKAKAGAGETGSTQPERAETLLSRQANHVTAQHLQALNYLARRFSLLVRRLTEAVALPFGPVWLSWHFDQALNRLDLPSQALAIVYREFSDAVLSGIGTITETLNSAFAGFGLLPELECSTSLKAALEHSEALAPSTTPAKDPAHGTKRIVSGDLRPLLQNLHSIRTQLAQAETKPASTPSPHVEALRSVLTQIIGDDRAAEDASHMLRQIERAVLASANANPDFFAKPDQPARRCLNLIARLVCESSFRGGPIRRQLPPICDRIQREHTQNQQIFQIVLPLLEELDERQKQTGARNKQRIVNTQDGQHKLLTAQRAIDEQLYQNYADKPFAGELRDILDQGWYRYLVQLQLKHGNDSNELRQALATLHHLHSTLHPTGAPISGATMSSDQLIRAITEPLENLGMASVHYHRAVFALRQALDRATASEAAAGNGDEPRFNGKPRPGIDRSPPVRLGIQPGDWMGWLDNPVDEPMQLAWSAPDHSRYVFVDEAGQMLFDLSGEQLAQDMRHGLQLVPDPEGWPRLEEAIYLAMQRSYAALSHRFRQDSQTGLPDRNAFETRLSDWIRFARYSGQSHSLVGISVGKKLADRDRGKGERYAQIVSALQRHCPAETDLGYLGEGLFAMLLPYSSDRETGQLTDTLKQLPPLAPSAGDAHGSASKLDIDCLLVSAGCTSAESLLSQLEARFEHVATDRPSGKSAVHEQRLDWINRLGQILDQDRLRLRCQSIVPVSADDTMHHEILLGVVDDNGLVSPPGELVAAAERYDRMDIFDRWVIQHTFKWLREHRARIRQLGCVHINLSSTALNSDRFLNFLLAELRPADLPHQALCFEISESAAIANLPKAANFIARVRSLSCHFALDNFGKSAQSLQLLRQLPVDIVKIDGSLTRQLPHQSTSLTLVDCIIQAAQAMGVCTIAECVENETILHQVDTLGIDFAQGYAVARPVLLDEI